MPDLALDLRYLSYAILVAEHGSFRAAAESIDLAQSTVSRRVQLLERRLGVTLFERGRNGTRLTPLGERFVRSAALGAEQLRLAISDARKVRRGETGELRIGTGTSLASGFLAELLARYRAVYPLIDLRLEEVSNHQGEAHLLRGNLDIAFLTVEPCSKRCKSVPLWRERIIIAMPGDHPFAHAQDIGWSELSRDVLILSKNEQECDFGRPLLKKLDGCSAPNVAVYGVGRDSILGLVSGGFGIFATLESTATDVQKNVAFVPLADEAAVQLYAVWGANDRNPAIQPFLDFAEAHSTDWSKRQA